MFLDIAFGVFGSYLTGAIFHEAITPYLVCMGILFVLLPDVDILWYETGKKVDHRGYMHYPLLYLIVTLLFVFSMGNKVAFLFFITTLFHFVHDTFILGWGVAWFAPFSHRHFKVFPDDGKGGFLQEKYLTWMPSEQEALEKKLNDPHWIRNWYRKVTIVSVVEYSAFFFAMIYMVYTFIL